MANSKISALTSATTPLAGTEVLPIVQSSTTVKATIANVQAAPVSAGTANGVQYLNASKVPTTGSALQFDGTNLGVGQYPSNAGGITTNIELPYGATLASRSNAVVPQLYIMSNAVGTGYAPTYKVAGYATQYTTQGFAGTHSFATAPSGAAGAAISFTDRLSISNAGDVTLNTGNLVQGTAAKGVNFTANTPAAGMTSQLLNWYEQGTWTPVDSSGASLSFTSVTGIYTRVGRLVTCTFGLTFPATANAAGVTIGGLPFTSLSSGTPNPSGGSITYTGAAVSAAGFAVGAGGTTVALYGASGTALTNATFSGFILRGQFTYTVN